MIRYVSTLAFINYDTATLAVCYNSSVSDRTLTGQLARWRIDKEL
jgi:hypothetical protein